MKSIIGLIAGGLALLAVHAFGQFPTVQQSGPVTAGDIPVWTDNGKIGDGSNSPITQNNRFIVTPQTAQVDPYLGAVQFGVGDVNGNYDLDLVGGTMGGGYSIDFYSGPVSSFNNLWGQIGTASYLGAGSGGNTDLGITAPNIFMCASSHCLVIDTNGGTTFPGATISGGTKFTIASGCGSPGSLTGGATTGSFTAGATSCAPVINLPPAPNGWWCDAKDITHPTDTFTQTAKSTNSCTLSATVTSSDIIVFHAEGY